MTMTFPPEPLPSHPHTLPQAIARVEGWYVIGPKANRPQRNCNPGNINFGAFSKSFGAVLETDTDHPRFACFPRAKDGWACLEALLAGSSYRNLTLEQAVNRFAPPSENDTLNYAALVSKWTGKPLDTLVADALASA